MNYRKDRRCSISWESLRGPYRLWNIWLIWCEHPWKAYVVVKSWSWEKLSEPWNLIIERMHQECFSQQTPKQIFMSKNLPLSKNLLFCLKIVFETRKEYYATLNTAVSKYRQIIIISEHLVNNDLYRTRDGYLNVDPNCSGTFSK